ncbi:hypothetical protein L195_g062410, partial [Trifolium pratense]
ASARRELAANHPSKRGRRKGPTPGQGTHDAEAGGSHTRARSRLGQSSVAQDEFDADQFLNAGFDYDDFGSPQVSPQDAPQDPPQQPPRQQRRKP